MDTIKPNLDLNNPPNVAVSELIHLENRDKCVQNHENGFTTQHLTLSVIIPVYNEKLTVTTVLQKILVIPQVKEIIVVDDGSDDGTWGVLKNFAPENNRITLLRHTENFGKGAALRTGLKGVSGDIVIIQDADLEYDPADFDQLVEPIANKNADVVFGSRFLGGNHRVLFFWHYVANKFLTTLSNMLTNLNLSDMTTCYKVFSRSVLDEIKFKSNRFGFEPEFTAKVAKKRYRIYEVPISYHGRDYSQGKKITWKDGFVMLWCIFRYNLFP